jgi:hypothetical protein
VPSSPARLQILGVLAVTIAWQIYVVVSAVSRAATFRKLFAGLGATLPRVTQIFFITCQWWFVVPLIFLALFIDCARRGELTARYPAIVTACSLAAGFALQAWATEACFGPMFALIKQIG